MKKTCAYWLCLTVLLAPMHVPAQTKRAPSAAPQIDVENYSLQVTLNPDAHDLKATASITFKPLQETDVIFFELNENLSVQRVLNAEGVEVEFGQDETGPGSLAIRFGKPLRVGADVTLKIEYTGGFDRDRYSRTYSRDQGNVYIGMEGSYLLYSAKWFPTNKFLSDRSTAKIEVTVPLGMTVIGPGAPLPVVTKGIHETFQWTTTHEILPNSIVAGRYFGRSINTHDFTIDCYAKEEHLESVEKSAEVLGKILEYYRDKFGAPAAGNSFRLVEVDDRAGSHSGMLGTVFITPREISQPMPPVRILARRAAYQWWLETMGARSPEDLWLVEGMAYYSAAQYLGESGAAALKEEINNLAVMALKSETKSAVRVGVSLGYKSETYESVVAGKGSWILHMLRWIMGETEFSRLQREYLQQSAGKGGSTAAFQKMAESIYGKDLGWFFAEWIDTTGVPTLQPEYVILRTRDGFRVSGTIKQDRDLFRMPVEVEITTKGKTERATVELNGKSTAFDINTYTLPRQIALDPDSKILRDSKELQVSVQLSTGDDMRLKGEFVEAIRAYESALRIDAHKSLAHFRLAETFYDQFNLQSAANSFRDALNGDKDPKWIEVWCYVYLGKIYDILGQRQRAMAEYNKAINTKDDTNNAQAEAAKWLAAPFTRERTTIEGKQTN
jgi:aminopeptidase N